MDIISSLKAFFYCAGGNTNARTASHHTDGDWSGRWLPLRTLLSASEVPVYLVAADKPPQPERQNAAKFGFAGTAHSKNQLSGFLSMQSTANPTSVLIAGCYAETLVTDVALAALKEGYDTLVIWDRVWAISEAGLEAGKARLLQAGVVPTSVDQVLHRWG